MKHASRTKQIQYSMERININPVYILPAPAYCFERQSRNKPDIFGQIHSIRLVLYNSLGNIPDIYLGKRTIHCSYSITSNNRFLSTYKVELVKVCRFRIIRIIDPVFCNNIKNSDNANPSSNRGRLYCKPDSRGVLQLGNSWILRGLYLGDYPSNINIQRLMADITSNFKDRCKAEHRILSWRDDDCNSNKLNRIWDINSWICNRPHSCLSRKHSGLHLSIHLHVYPSPNLLNHWLIPSNSSHNSQCLIQSGLCDSPLNWRSINCDNISQIKMEETK